MLAPPQSTPVSVPFRAASVHVGAAQAPAAQTPLRQLAPLVPHMRPSAHRRAGAHAPPQSTSVSVPLRSRSVHSGAAQVPFTPHTPLTQSAAIAQAWPSAQRRVGAHVPPQSTAVSVPFLTVSMQVGTAQAPAVQTPLWQLVPLAPHMRPLAQDGQDPPQSTSVSVPLRVVSVQAAAAHLPVRHTPLVQSPITPQAWPSAQRRVGAHIPPQSTAVSVPFLTVSVQVGAAQTPAVQTPLAQLVGPVPHMRPLAHGPQDGPPQSRSVSAPFLTMSVHVPAAHTPAVHTPLAQLAPLVPHMPPSAQRRVGAQEPPQSVSVSVPFRTMSVHAGAVHVPFVPHTPL
ncbi:MAG: hypothetical protein ABUL77_00290 [Bacteroidota bacterium]